MILVSVLRDTWEIEVMVTQNRTCTMFIKRVLALFVLTTWPWLAVQAQETSAGNDNGQEVTAEEQAQAVDADAALEALEQAAEEGELETDENLGLSDRFIPSEQISQDLGVSYPVDI
jgi:hypothetical protein